MTQIELAKVLRTMYNDAPDKEKVLHIHLFGILYAQEITDNKFRLPDLLHIAEMNDSYKTEISKGIKLSRYVQVDLQIKEKYKTN